MTSHAVIVDFRLKPGARAAFRRAVDENARISAETERGCLRFDVIEPLDEVDRVILYEIYEDGAAFEAHASTAHYRRFDAETAASVRTKTVMRCDLVFEAVATAGKGSAPRRGETGN